MRHVYLAATGQNRGKTTVSLGVLDGFQRRGLSAAFLKPVGQRTIIEDGVPADEDAVLMKQVFGLREPLQQMSPVHIPRGFTQAYIEGRVVEDLPARIRAAHAAFLDRDILLIEGTGHAGVGAVIGLSNATVAGLLGAPAVIVSEGGVGRPIDEIVLNAALFERSGVRVAGAIVNKVDLDAKPGLARTLETRPRAPRHPAARASCRTGRSCRTRPWRWSSRASTARRSTPAPTSTRSSAGSRSARWSPNTCSIGSGRAAW